MIVHFDIPDSIWQWVTRAPNILTIELSTTDAINGYGVATHLRAIVEDYFEEEVSEPWHYRRKYQRGWRESLRWRGVVEPPMSASAEPIKLMSDQEQLLDWRCSHEV